MIRTKNPGILEAIREVKTMSLSKRLWMLYEARLKEKRDANAREEYVRNEGIQIGVSQGITQGITLAKEAYRLSSEGRSTSEIAKELHISETQVENILKN